MALVTTPSGYHLEPTLACAERKIHVLCDKPLEITPARCDTMIEACDAAGVHLGCIFQSRFTPELQPLHDAAKAGRFGALSIISGYVPWYRDDEYYSPSRWQGTLAMDGGGACMNQAIHTIDVLIWLAGAADGETAAVDVNPVAEVVAFTAQRAHSAELIEVEDTAVVSLRFRNGALGQILGATSMYPGSDRLVWLAGRNGTAELRGDDLTRWEFRIPEAGDENVTKPKVAEKVASGGAASPFANFNTGPPRSNIEAFLQSLEAADPSESKYPIGGREAKKAVEVVTAIYEAARTGKSVAIE